MSRRVLSHDPMTGITTFFDYDDMTDTTIVSYEQDCDDIIEHNKRLQNAPEYSKQGMKQEMWHYASIPNVLITKWLTEEGINVYDDNDWPKIYKKLNDPEYRYLKATTGTHS